MNDGLKSGCWWQIFNQVPNSVRHWTLEAVLTVLTGVDMCHRCNLMSALTQEDAAPFSPHCPQTFQPWFCPNNVCFIFSCCRTAVSFFIGCGANNPPTACRPVYPANNVLVTVLSLITCVGCGGGWHRMSGFLSFLSHSTHTETLLSCPTLSCQETPFPLLTMACLP